MPFISAEAEYKKGEPFLLFENQAFQAIIQQGVAGDDGNGTDFPESDSCIHPIAVRMGFHLTISQ